jgi:hypothetical protein
MNNITKEREKFTIGNKTNLHSTNNEDSVLSKIDPRLIEAYLAREMAKVESENCKLPVHQITIFADRTIASNFQTLTVPLVGDEIAIHNRNGIEQIYRVTKIRHSAYLSTAKLQRPSNISAVVWCELINNPVKLGVVF